MGTITHELMHALGKKLLFEWHFTHGMKVQRLEWANSKRAGTGTTYDHKGDEDRSEDSKNMSYKSEPPVT